MAFFGSNFFRQRCQSLRWFCVIATFTYASLTGSIALQAAPIPSDKPAAYPSWWFAREVVKRIDPNNTAPLWANGSYPGADDYAAVNLGQLKQIATAAYDELNAHLPGGAGPALDTLVKGWFQVDASGNFILDAQGNRQPRVTAQTDNFVAANLGQLKAVAKPFYDRLIAVRYTTAYPWAAPGHSADDWSVANLGQVKRLFSFDITKSTLNDGLPDWWVLAWNLGSVTDPSVPNADPDGDNVSNLNEFLNGTDPTDFYNGAPVSFTASLGTASVANLTSVVPANTTLSQPYTVTVVDANNQPWPNAPVTFSILVGNAKISANGSSNWSTTGITVRTGSNGVAAFYLQTLAPGLVEIAATTGKAGNIPPVIFGFDVRNQIQIANGGDHTVTIRQNGSVWAWGANFHGQLGNGTASSPSSPVPVGGAGGFANVVTVAAGQSHSLALKNDGTVWAWGSNGNGQLGDGSTTDCLLPEQVATGAAAIACGKNFSFILKSDGTVWAAGANESGQLGDGSATERHGLVQVSGLTATVAIAGGADHGLAVKADGTVWSWGNNTAGQLGDGTTNQALVAHPLTASAGEALATTVVAGEQFSAALTQDGHVWTWGANGSGQLGNGSFTNSGVPVRAGTLTGVTNLAMGNGHLIASNGTSVWAWGANDLGQIGDGTTINRNAPTTLATFDSGTTVTGVAAGYKYSTVQRSNGDIWTWGNSFYQQSGLRNWLANLQPLQVSFAANSLPFSAGYAHSLAVQSDGTVWSWGDNNYGELGDGTNTSRTSAVTVPGLSGIVAVSAGYYHSLALRSDGTVLAWGANWSGQLGNNSTTPSASPVVVQGFTSPIMAIAAGDGFSLAVDTNGAVWAWGENAYGTLGNGTFTDSPVAVQLTGISKVFSVAAGDQFAIALRNDGTVWAWGANSYGQLGCDPGTTPVSNVPVPVPSFGLVEQISAGTGFAMALTSDGNVWSWGANWYGQLGNNSTTNSSTPVQAQNLAKPATAIGAGDGFAAARLNDGTVKEWGANWYGQLGNQLNANSLAPVQVKSLSGQTVGNLSGVTAIAVGDGHVIALNTSGQFWSWGNDEEGQLGNGSTANNNIATAARGFLPEIIPAGTSLLPLTAQVGAGAEHSVALKNDGTVWAWGNNLYGQLGLDTSIPEMPYPIQVPGLADVSSISVGENFALALRAGGTVWSWGFNGSGQLGNGTSNNSSLPGQVSNLNGVTAVAAGYIHGLAIINGAVWSWGSNGWGQLGDGTTSPRNKPVPVQGLSGRTIVAVAAGQFHSLALTSDGLVFAWGYNQDGQLGNSAANPNGQTTPLQVQGLTGVVKAIAAGEFYSMALMSDGSVWTWGDNTFGQLGNGDPTRANKFSPVQVTGFTQPVIAIASKYMHSMAITSDGTAWAWGSNTYGQLGDGTTTRRDTPTIAVQGLSGVTFIAAGEEHSVVVRNDGTVWAFGSNSFSEIGNGHESTEYPDNNIFSTPTRAIGLDLLGYAPASLAVQGGAIVSGSTGNIVLQAAISDNARDVVKVDFYNGATLIGSATSAPFVYSWQNVPPGTYSITVKTTTSKGLVAVSTPVLVKVMLTGYDSIAGGDSYATVVRADGTVWSWGANESGQMGDATTIERHGPVVARSLNSVVSIAEGGSHTVALKNDGTVWAWGANAHGQLGNGNTNDSHVPVQTSGLSGIIAVAAGENESYALRNDGSVFAWGANGNGQLGNNSTTDKSTPVLVTTATGNLSGILAIAATGDHCLALRNDGTLFAWGANAHGQLGNGGNSDSWVAVPVSGAPAGVVAIAAGVNHSMALTTGGAVWAWGANANNQLGNGSGNDSSTPIPVSGVTGVSAIAAGGDHCLALLGNGTLVAWGSDARGELGNGVSTGTSGPISVPGLTGVIAVGAGTSNSYAVSSDGTVHVWGANDHGQLGNGTMTDSSSPLTIGELNGTIATAEGAAHTLALHSDGTVWAWGSNSSGQLGNNLTAASQTPVQTVGLTGVVAVAAGVDFSLALKADGTVWAWGKNNAGQVGDGTNLQRLIPVQVKGLSGIVAISAGADYAMALTNGGSVLAWGSGADGQMANGGTANNLTPNAITALSGISQIAAGGYHGLALDNSNAVWSWGYNNDHQLGNSSTTNGLTAVQISGLSGVVAIAGGGFHSLALKSDGTVVAWGDNEFGQLGNNSTTSTGTPVQAGTLSGIISIAAGKSHSVAIQNNGTVWIWGDNSLGELGVNSTSTTQSTTPVSVGGLNGAAVQISTGNQAGHTFALKSDGTLWGWGLNTSGQLENGGTTTQFAPGMAQGIGTPLNTSGTGPVITLTEPSSYQIIQ